MYTKVKPKTSDSWVTLTPHPLHTSTKFGLDNFSGQQRDRDLHPPPLEMHWGKRHMAGWAVPFWYCEILFIPAISIVVRCTDFTYTDSHLTYRGHVEMGQDSVWQETTAAKWALPPQNKSSMLSKILEARRNYHTHTKHFCNLVQPGMGKSGMSVYLLMTRT